MQTIVLLVGAVFSLLFLVKKEHHWAIGLLLITPMLTAVAEFVQMDQGVPLLLRYYSSDLLSLPAAAAILLVGAKVLNLKRLTVRHIKPLLGLVWILFIIEEFKDPATLDLNDIFVYCFGIILAWLMLGQAPEDRPVVQMI